jgi:hypothetical protein
MFGGYTGGADIQDLWTWNGTNWVETTLSGASLPVARKWAAMASDGNTAIILWGGDVNGTLDDSVWVINPTTGETGENIPEFPRPEARKMHSMYYDSLQDAVIMFGGRSMVDNEPLNDAWSYKNSAWTPLEVSAEFVARAANHNVAYDTAKHRTLIAPGGMIARGSITPMRGARYKDNDAFDLDDGQNPAITIEHIKVFEPRRVTNWADSYLKFDLETLLGSTDQSGTSIRFECIPTATSGTAVSYYSGGKNMVDTADLLGQTPPPSTQQEDYIVSLVPAQPDFIKIKVNDTKAVVAAKTIAIINAATPLKMEAFADDEDIEVFHTESREDSNVDITEAVDRDDFVVAGMVAVADTWTHNPSGGIWLEHEVSVQPEIVDGAMLAYDANVGKFVLAGGYNDGSPTLEGYLWTWDPDGLSPLYSLPGELQGRVQSPVVPATDGAWSMILGVDKEHLPSYILTIGDTIVVTQENVAITGKSLLKFDWRMRYAHGLQRYNKILDAGTVDFVTSGLVKSAPGPDSLIGIRAPTPIFEEGFAQQWLKVTGSSQIANDGSFRMTVVPSDQGDLSPWNQASAGSVQAGRVAILENAAMVPVVGDTGVTLEVHGVRWRASLDLHDGIAPHRSIELVESEVQADGDGWLRAGLAANVSKYSGLADVIFTLILEAYPTI